MVKIVTGHRLEDLFDALVEQLTSTPLAPLASETVLVPGQGIARWLELRLADRLGIAAGIEMPFLSAYLHRLTTPPDDAGDPFTREVLVFRLWRLLSESRTGADGGPFGPASAYCKEDPDGIKKLQLSMRLARCFDEYQLYRPDLLRDFATGEDHPGLSPHARWQARLWRALLEDAGLGRPRARRPQQKRDSLTPSLFPELDLDAPNPRPTDHAHRLPMLERLLDDDDWCRRKLPPRLFVFGPTSLPPTFLALLQRLATRLPVQMFVPQPTPHYVGDLRSQKPRAGDNALLTQFGAESREFQGLLLDLEDRGPVERVDLDELDGDDREPSTLLQCLQGDIVHARDRGERGAERFRLRRHDASVQIHDCHSPQRELEVVRDQICRAFAEDPSLCANDVLVLVPDIDRYAPYAHAVFGPLGHRLPFHVADRHPARELPTCRTLLRVLDLADSRLPLGDVLHLLEDRAVQRRFGLFPTDIEILRHLCHTADIRWGLDAESRARQFDLPAFGDNSWQQGLERLLLGTLTGPVDELVLGRLPLADTTESRGELLARFLTFTRTLFDAVGSLRRPLPLLAWADAIEHLAETLFAPEDGAQDEGLQAISRCVTDLRSTAQLAEHKAPISLPALRTWLEDALGQGASARGFLGGSITIAAMLPMRAVPVRCLFLCGLDDESFPRRDRPLPFDLIANKPRPGDRSRRRDDRQLFLDLLLSARDRLHLTFVGHSAKDNAVGAPSVVISELLDHIDRTCKTDDGAPARAQVVLAHPLQPWSRRYHDGRDPRLFTVHAPPPPTTRSEALPWCAPGQIVCAPGADAEALALDALLSFWANPCRYFLTRSLQMRLATTEAADEADEPFGLDALTRWQLQDALVQRVLRGEPDLGDALARARQQGLLPVGAHGDAGFQALRSEAEALLREARRQARARARPVDIQVQVSPEQPPVRITGTIDGFVDDELVWLRVGSLRPKDRLHVWLLHLVVAQMRHQDADAQDPWPTTTTLQLRDRRYRYQEVSAAEAEQHLATLIRWYREGCSRPLAFFPAGSCKAGEKLAGNNPNPTAALHAGRQCYEIRDPDNPYRYDLGDEAIALCMRDRDPFADGERGEFVRIASEVWPPVLAHLLEVPT